MRTVVNRVLLALVGAALLVLGLLVLIGSLDLARRWNLDLPGWWPLDNPDQPLLTRETRTRWTDRGWWWPSVIAALAVLVLLCLWWLLAQLRTRRLGQIRVPAREEDEAARLRAHALEDALATEIHALDGVDRARVTLHGRRRAPRARIVLALAAHASPASLAGRIDREALGNARTSAGLPALPAEIRLRSDRHPATRVE